MKTFISLLLFTVISSQLIIAQDDGSFKSYYEKGQIKTVGSFKDKRKVGQWIEYYDTGEVMVRAFYSHENLDYVFRSFYKNGVLKSEEKSQNNIYVYKEYYENKVLYLESSSEGGYKKYTQEGVLETERKKASNGSGYIHMKYYTTGEIEWQINELDYNGQYRYTQYYKNGNIKVKGELYHDFKQGEEERYSEKGTLEWIGSYYNDKMHKKWKHYDDSGKIIETVKFKMGRSSKKVVNLTPTKIPEDYMIEHVPVYPGCENLAGNNAKKKCMSHKVALFVSNNFNPKVAKGLNIDSRTKLNIIFKVNKEGKVEGIRARAQRQELVDEAVRVIRLLPKMKPGKQMGKTVIVPFSIPIILDTQAYKFDRSFKINN